MKSYTINEKDVMLELMLVKKRISESSDYLKALICYYNESFESLSLAECLWLEKYLTRMGEYCVVNIDGCEKIILRSEAVEKGYTIEEYNSSKKYSKVCNPVVSTNFSQTSQDQDLDSLLKTKLLPNGFEVVYNDEKQLIAFNKERLITFYVDNIDSYKAGYYYFQKPIMTVYNKMEIARYNNLETAYNTSFCNFPIFSHVEYLNLYSLINDVGDSFDVSMKKISQIPILMEVIGKDNRKIVEQTISRSVNKVKLKKI